MISFFVSCVCLGSSTTNIVERVTLDRNVWSGKLYLDTYESIPMELDFASNTSFFPKFNVKTLPVHLYTFRMTQDVVVESGFIANTHYMQLSPWNISEFSIILNLYKTDFFFLSEPPRETMIHLKDETCHSKTDVFDMHENIIKLIINGVEVGLSYSQSMHTIRNTSLCHWQRITFPGSDFLSVYINCLKNYSSSTSQYENVLSASMLDIGLYYGNNTICLYRPDNEELDHEFAITLVGFLFVFLCTWIEWTRQSPDNVWMATTVTYAPLVYQVIILVISTSIYARSQKSHNIYNFATMRMLDKNTVDTTAMIFSWIVSPIIGSMALFVMAIGKLYYDKLHYDDSTNFNNSTKYNDTMDYSQPTVASSATVKYAKPFGWGIPYIENKPIAFRYVFTVFVFTIVYGILYSLWVLGLQDWRGSVAIAVTILPTFIHFSNPNWLSNYLANHITEIRRILKQNTFMRPVNGYISILL